MNILQVNKFFYLKGGSERYFFDLSEALEQEGHRVIHFSMHHPKNRKSPCSENFVKEIDFQGKRSLGKAAHFVYSFEAQELIKRACKQNKPDIVHVHNIAHQLTPSIFVSLQRLKVPIVQTLHDYQLICPNYRLYTNGAICERCKSHKYWNAIQQRCVQDRWSSSFLSACEMAFHNIVMDSYGHVDRFIAPSQFLYTKLLEWGRKKSSLMYLPHFVEKQRQSHIQKKKQILYIGRLTAEKGVDVLIEAAQGLPEGMEVLIAGEGPLQEELEKRVSETNAPCRFLGFQSTPELDKLVQESLAVVVPSVWYENAPMVVYEALALGTPVIASRLGGLIELIEEGKNGYLFQAGDSAELRKKIEIVHSQEPLQISENQYTKERHMKELLQLYEELRAEKASK